MSTARARGPMFDGRAQAAVAAFVREFEEEYSQRGANMVRQHLGGVLQHPTGRYESGIHTDRAGGDSQVTDNRAIYGPWLEGTGSRNRTTRFKGYKTFRQVTQRMQSEAGSFGSTLIRSRFLGRME